MPEPQPALVHYLHVLRRQLWLIVLMVALALGAAALVNVLVDPVYRASMKIVVGQGGGVFQPGLGGDVQPFTQTMTNLLESDIVASIVIQNLDLELAPEKLLEDVQVTSAPDSSVLNVTYDSTEESEAVAVLEEVGVVFTELVDQNLGQATDAPNPITASVFDPAHLEPDPVAPRTVRNFAIAGALGLALGLILAFVRDALDDRVRGRGDAERWFRAPVVGTLPPGLHGRPPVGLAGRPPERADLVEALQLLRANVEFSQAGIAGPATVVTSALPEEGKTSVVANLSVGLALAGHDVICVEADLRRPKLQEYLGMRGVASGLADVLEGRAELADCLVEVPLSSSFNGAQPRSGRRNVRVAPPPTATSNGRLHAIFAGRAVTNPADLMSADRIGALVEELRGLAAYVIFDTPPLLLVGDAFLLARLSDSVIVVAREGRTQRGAAESAHVTLEGLGVSRVSVVITESRARDGYAYGYGGYGVSLPEPAEADAGAAEHSQRDTRTRSGTRRREGSPPRS